MLRRWTQIDRLRARYAYGGVETVVAVIPAIHPLLVLGAGPGRYLVDELGRPVAV